MGDSGRGNVQFGDDATIHGNVRVGDEHYYAAPPPPLALTGSRLLAPNPLFVGRDDLLADLAHYLAQPMPASVRPTRPAMQVAWS